ncbi:hypothetical protein [Aestuariivirga sp.]|uniref:hypothetical protein n=1 Tax=Aestuariivirga sp. TaxID=2650926 RepID=UPI0039E32F21
MIIALLLMVVNSPDSEIIFWGKAPFASGKGLSVKVQVGNQQSIATNVYLDYAPPKLNSFQPGSVQFRSEFATAQYGSLVLMGSGFGYSKSPINVLVNGQICANPTWVDGTFEESGQPSVQCDLPKTISGPRSTLLCASGSGGFLRQYSSDAAIIQAGAIKNSWGIGKIDETWAVRLESRHIAACANNTMGRPWELCRNCPDGAICTDRFVNPKARATFFMETFEIYDRSTGELNDKAAMRCPPEMLNDTLLDYYPGIVRRDSCIDYVRCDPREACLEGNNCAEGYTYAYELCQIARNESKITGNGNFTNTCRVVLNPKTNEYEGVHSDCRGDIPLGHSCPPNEPKKCSICSVSFIGLNESIPVGTCECDMPSRCALCKIYSHYRLNDKCEVCPDNPGLLIALFLIAGLAIIGAGYFLSKRQVNLAFMSIGVDYLQVLALFASTNITWPPYIRYLLTVFSLFNFNIDITAPECLVPSLEYEIKWWLVELLPVVVFGLLIAIHVLYTTYKILKQGRRSQLL